MIRLGEQNLATPHHAGMSETPKPTQLVLPEHQSGDKDKLGTRTGEQRRDAVRGTHTTPQLFLPVFPLREVGLFNR